jgi:hypothetical protein
LEPVSRISPEPSEAGTTGTLTGKGYFPCMRIVISLLLRRMKVEDNLWDDQVSVVQRRSVELDEDFVLADLGTGASSYLSPLKSFSLFWTDHCFCVEGAIFSLQLISLDNPG